MIILNRLRNLYSGGVYIIQKKRIIVFTRKFINYLKKNIVKGTVSENGHERMLIPRKGISGFGKQVLPAIDDFTKLKFIAFLADPDNKLRIPQFKEPIVSIVILLESDYYEIYQCLESILTYATIPYEVVVSYLNESEELKAFQKRTENILFIKSDPSTGVVERFIECAEKSGGHYILILKDDTIITQNCLEYLVKITNVQPDCGAVGAKILARDGRLVEAGGMAWSHDNRASYGYGDMPYKPQYSYVREIAFCSEYCLLIRKNLLAHLNIPLVADSQKLGAGALLCGIVYENGFKTIYQPASTVFCHDIVKPAGNKRHRYEENVGTAATDRANKKHDANISVLTVRSVRKSANILVLDAYVPAISYGSGYPRSYQMLKCLAKLGYSVTFFPVSNTSMVQPYTKELQQMGIEVFWGDELSIDQFMQNRAGYYDVVIISRPTVFERTLGPVKKYLNSSTLIYDMEAIFATREILKAEVSGQKLKPDKIQKMLEDEFNLISKADLIISASNKAGEFLKENASFDNAMTWSYLQDITLPETNFAQRKDLLFVGSFFAGQGSPNEDAAIYFANDIFPEVSKALSCRLFIVGIDPTPAVKKLAGTDIIVTGYVDDLKPYFDNCRVFIVPTRFSGLGIPIKLVEGMSHGIPAVATELIASMLDLTDEKEVLIARDKSDFVHKVIRLYQEEKLWYQIQANALKYIETNYSSRIAIKTLDEIMQHALKLKGLKRA
jgi:glycosyltransferase involved in cell wall biosynthesis